MKTIEEQLIELGVRLRGFHAGNQKTLCPKCSHQRKKKTDPCLSVTLDQGEARLKCHNCGWGHVITERADTPARLPKRRIAPAKPAPVDDEQSIPEKVLGWFLKRGISADVVKKNRIFYTKVWMPQYPDVKEGVPVIAFPYFRRGEAVNVKYRTAEKHFRQVKDAEKILYGIDDVTSDATDLIWVEGEMDKLALNEAGYWNVVSPPDGAPSAFRWSGGDNRCVVHKSITDPSVKECEACGAKRDGIPSHEDDAKFEYLWNCREFIGRFSRHILAFDSDTPGLILMDEIARRIGKEKCWKVAWPNQNDSQIKDANEALLECGVDVVRECIGSAAPYPIEGLYQAADFESDVLRLYNLGRARGVSTGFFNLDKIYSIVPGQLSVVTGYPGSGKSEFIDALNVNLATNNGWVHAVCSFENPQDEHIAKLAAKWIGAPFYDGPTPRMSEWEVQSALRWINKHFIFIKPNDTDSPTIDWILEKAEAAVFRYGIRTLTIDPYNEIEHKIGNGVSETKYISETLSKVKRFAARCGVHVFFVAHPKTLERREHIGQAPGLYDISGGANWSNKTDFGISVHRAFMPDGKRSRKTEIHVKKVRFQWAGTEGIVALEHQATKGGKYVPSDLD